MKKLTRVLTILLALCLVISLAACGGGDEKDDKKDPPTPTGGGNTADAGYVFKYKGVEIPVDADLASIISALGEATSYFESESCAFQGLDKVWTYGGIIIRSYPEGGKDCVLSVELRDDSVSTPEGVYIGSSESDVKAAYGNPSSASDKALIYVKGPCTLTFLLEGGKVSGITYTSGVLTN